MIGATELRIGNIVEHEDPDEIVEGIHYFDDGYRILIGNHLRPIEEIKAVPITPWILKKFGFKMSNLNAKGELYFKPDTGFSLVEISAGWQLYSHCFIIQILDVHQLQNLFFALTGQELNYKP